MRPSRAAQQGGPGEQQERCGDLDNDEEFAEDLAGRASAEAAAVGTEGGQQVEAGGGERGGEAEEQGREDGDGGDESGHAPTGVERELPAFDLDEGGRSPGCESACGYGAEGAQQSAFGEEMTDDAAASGAEREANADLVSARGGASEEQVRDVAACDQQDGGGNPDEDEKRVRRLGVQFGEDLVGRLQLDVEIGTAEVGQLAVEGGQGGRRLVAGDAGFEAGRYFEPGVVGRVQPVGGEDTGLHAHGQPDVRGIAGRFAEESSGHDADDRDGGAVDIEGRAEGRRAGEVPLPEGVADHGDGGGGTVVGIGEAAAAAGANAEHVEIVAGNQLGVHRFDRALSAEDGLSQRCVAGGEHAVRDLLARGHFAIHRVAEWHALAVAGEIGDDELLGLTHGQSAEDNGVEYLIDGRIGADSEGEGEDGRGGESRSAA